MRIVSWILIILAGLAFIVGLIIKALDKQFLGFPPLTIWRFVIACLGFAIAITLMELTKRPH
jgi:hypothetical protein